MEKAANCLENVSKPVSPRSLGNFPVVGKILNKQEANYHWLEDGAVFEGLASPVPEAERREPSQPSGQITDTVPWPVWLIKQEDMADDDQEKEDYGELIPETHKANQNITGESDEEERSQASGGSKELGLKDFKREVQESPLLVSTEDAAAPIKMKYKTSMFEHTGKPLFRCDICGEKFQRQSGLTRHQRHKHNTVETYSCYVCGKGFTYIKSLNTHELTHSDVSISSTVTLDEAKARKRHLTDEPTDRNAARDVVFWKGVETWPAPPIIKQEDMDDDDDMESQAYGKWIPETHGANQNITGESNEQERSQSSGGSKELRLEDFKTEQNPLLVSTEDAAAPVKKKYDKRYTCEICGKTETKKARMTSHMRRHTGMPFNCDICGEKFQCQKLLTRHKRSNHYTGIIYSCSVCGKTFMQATSRDTHERGHTGKNYWCSDCGETFKERQERDTHECIVYKGDRPFSCSECNKDFERQYHLKKHQLEKHPLMVDQTVDPEPESKHFEDQQSPLSESSEAPTCFTCDIYCGKTFKERQDRDTHECIVYKGDRPYSCSECNEDFERQYHLKKHQLEKHPLMVEQTVDPEPESKHFEDQTSQFESAESSETEAPTCFTCDIYNHECKHIGEDYWCSDCGKTFKERQDRDVHKCIVYKGDRPFRCSECNEDFERQYHLKRHQLEKHPLMVDQPRPGHDTDMVVQGAQPSTDNDLKAEMSLRNFPVVEQILNEQEANGLWLEGDPTVEDKGPPSLLPEGEEPLQPLGQMTDMGVETWPAPLVIKQEEMDDDEMESQGYSEWIPETHKANQNITGESDEEERSQASGGSKELGLEDLKREQSPLLVSTEDAPAPVKKKYNKRHQRSKHTVKTYSCSMCEKTFLQATSRDTHERGHAGKNYWCSDCGEMFKERGDRDTHECIVYKGERPFSCSECSEAFQRQYHLKQHQLEKHPLMVEQTDDPENRVEETIEKPCSCSVCGMMFVYPKSRDNHERKHIGEDYWCSGCGKTFKERQDRDTHECIVYKGDRPFRCSECNEDFERQYHLKKHQLEKHPLMGVETWPAPLVIKQEDDDDDDDMESQGYNKWIPETHKANQNITGESDEEERSQASGESKELGLDDFNREQSQLLVSTGDAAAPMKNKYNNINIKRNTCEICGKIETNKGRMTSHMIKHTGLPFSCDICGKKFKRQDFSTRHKRSKHNPGITYSCSLLESPELENSCEESEYEYEPPSKMRIPQPEPSVRRLGAMHMPEMMDTKHAERCRNKGCKSKTYMRCLRNFPVVEQILNEQEANGLWLEGDPTVEDKGPPSLLPEGEEPLQPLGQMTDMGVETWSAPLVIKQEEMDDDDMESQGYSEWIPETHKANQNITGESDEPERSQASGGSKELGLEDLKREQSPLLVSTEDAPAPVKKKYNKRHQRSKHTVKTYSCSMCEKTFLQATSRDTHERGHAGKNYWCSDCGEMFKERGDRDTHECIVYKGERPFSCSECSEAFQRQYHLKQHQLEKHPLMVEQTDDPENRVEETIEKPCSCSVCGMMFVYPKSRDNHERKHIGEDYWCSGCGKTFKERQDRDTHECIVYKGDRPFRCSECNEDFERQKLGYNYFPTCLRNFPVVDQILNEQEANGIWLERDPTVEEKGPPSLVPVGEEQSQALSQTTDMGVETWPAPLVIKQEEEDDDDDDMESQGYNKWIPETHKANQNITGESDEEERSQASGGSKELGLDDFNREQSQLLVSTGDAAAPMKNKYNNINIKRNTCEICGKIETNKGRMTSHMIKHTGLPFSCDICAKKFKRQDFLTRHKRSKHNPGITYSCSVCGKTFRQATSRDTHERGHTGKNYWCSDCGETFKERRDRDTHDCIVYKGERPFSCSECNKDFERQYHLKKHQMEKHPLLVEQTVSCKPTCSVCGKVFMYIKWLIRHERSHREKNEHRDRDAHKSIVEDPINEQLESKDREGQFESAESSEAPIRSEPIRYTCEICKSEWIQRPQGQPEITGESVRKREVKPLGIQKNLDSTTSTRTESLLVSLGMLQHHK
ncbi:unnamed protein product [Coregonus sp. 'balchen']|nr:unnamed protein product [Coregonus sp. 'balchen']